MIPNYNRVVKQDYATWYYLDNQLHRTDGPAIEYSNSNKIWYQFGLIHREDGPALITPDGLEQWYWKGKILDCQDRKTFQRLIKLRAFW